MAALPSFWELLLPNIFGNGSLNVTVVIGIIMILILLADSLLLAGTIFNSLGRALSIATAGRINALNARLYFLLIALVMIYAVSIFQDLTRTIEGTLILLGSSLIIIYIIMILTKGSGGKKVSGSRNKFR